MQQRRKKAKRCTSPDLETRPTIHYAITLPDRLARLPDYGADGLLHGYRTLPNDVIPKQLLGGLMERKIESCAHTEMDRGSEVAAKTKTFSNEKLYFLCS